MANEATVRAGLTIKKDDATGEIDYNARPTAFNVTVTGAAGPTPGLVIATTAGVNVDLSKLTTPGLCRLFNQDPTNYVEYGIWDPEGNKFYPLGEIGPGESYPIKLSRNIEEEYGTGTGTTGANTNRLRLKANTASCNCLVEAFER